MPQPCKTTGQTHCAAGLPCFFKDDFFDMSQSVQRCGLLDYGDEGLVASVAIREWVRRDVEALDADVISKNPPTDGRGHVIG